MSKIKQLVPQIVDAFDEVDYGLGKQAPAPTGLLDCTNRTHVPAGS